MSNEVMRPAIRRWVDNPEALRMLRAHAPEQFDYTRRRYVNRAEEAACAAAVGPLMPEDPVKLALLERLPRTRLGVSAKGVAEALTKAIADKDALTIVQIRRYLPNEFKRSLGMLKLMDRNQVLQGLTNVDAAVKAGKLKGIET